MEQRVAPGGAGACTIPSAVDLRGDVDEGKASAEPRGALLQRGDLNMAFGGFPATDGTERAQRSLADIASLVALPASWADASLEQAVGSVLEALVEILDAGFVRVVGPGDFKRVRAGSTVSEDAVKALSSAGAVSAVEIGLEKYTIASAPIGLSPGLGQILAGATRSDFGDTTDMLVLKVAATQVALALQRVHPDIGTSELAEANAALRREVLERQRAEEALRSSEREYREIVDNTPSLIGLLTPAGSVELVNRQILEFTGKSLEELSKWGMSDLVHPDDMSGATATFSAGFAGGEPFKIVYRMRNAQGEYRWFEGLHRPLRDAAGKVVRWSVACTDIHDRKQAEDMLRATERAWRSVLNGIPGLTATLSPVGMVEAVNRQIVDYTGCELEELRDWGTNGIVHPDDMPHVAKIFISSIEAGVPYEIEQRLRRHDGEYRWFSNRGTPAFDAEGNIQRWYVLLVDIHDARSVADALRASEENARYIVSSIAGMVAVFTPDGQLSGGNQQLLDYFDLPIEEVAKWATNGITHPDDLQHCIDSFLSSIVSGEPYDFETRFRRADGEYRWFHIRGRPLRDGDGRIVRWYGLLIDVHDRKRAEEAVARRENEMRQMADSIAAGIVVFAPDGQILDMNRQLQEYAGFSTDGLRNWGSSDFVHPDDIDRVRAFFHEWITKGTVSTVVGRLRRHDGVYRWYQASNTAVRDELGNVIRWYGLFTDIDDRKRAEETIAASARNLKITVDTIPALVWSARPDGTADFFNRHYLDYVGQTPEELGGWAWTSAVHAADLERLGAVWQTARETGGPAECEARLRRSDGVYRWFIFRAHPLRDDMGNVEKWYGINTDIEDRKTAEDALRRSQTLLAKSQEISHTGSSTWNVRTGEFSYSDEMYNLFEIEPGTRLTSELIASRVYEPDRGMTASRIKTASDGSRDAFDYEVRLKSSTVGLKTLRVRAQRVHHPERGEEFLSIAQDVTEQRRAEEALSELRAELAHVSRVSTLGAMTASIAHEVNQPLAGIITNANTCIRMLDADPPDIVGARDTARRTIRDGNRAAEVVTRLRALFRKRGQIADDVDLNEAARDVIALAATELRKSRVELDMDLADDLPAIAGDRVQLQQVILNLLLNAADAMSGVDDRPRRTTIVTNQDEDGNVQLTVRDTGVGIDPGDITRLFEAFYTTKEGGMGIGLSVSRSIIERHGGRIWAGANDGPGASISFVIPPRPAAGVEGGVQ